MKRSRSMTDPDGQRDCGCSNDKFCACKPRLFKVRVNDAEWICWEVYGEDTYVYAVFYGRGGQKYATEHAKRLNARQTEDI